MSAVNIHRPRVLVAEPDPETAALIGRRLEWAGYTVTTTGNGGEALELIGRIRPEAAVLEVTMDVLTGYEVVRSLREDPRHHQMAALLISARAGKLDRDFAFTVGADEYVKKPFLASELVERLALLVPSPAAPKKPSKANVKAPESEPSVRAIARPVRRTRPRTLHAMPAFAR